jgi:hypothetical protein
MTERTCPLCGANFSNLYRFCPFDATPLIEAVAPEAAPAPAAATRGPVTRRAVVGRTTTQTNLPAAPARPAVHDAPTRMEPVVRPQAPPPEAEAKPAPQRRPVPLPPERSTPAAAAEPAPAAPPRAARTAAPVEPPEPAPLPEPPPPARKKPRFSETEWFRRPILDAQVDPETGKVLVPDSAYEARSDRKPSERKGYTLDDDKA